MAEYHRHPETGEVWEVDDETAAAIRELNRVPVPPLEDDPASPAAVTEDFPLTCEWCASEPATHLLAYDTRRAGRRSALIGDACTERNADQVVVVAKTPASGWLFRLTPVELRLP